MREGEQNHLRMHLTYRYPDVHLIALHWIAADPIGATSEVRISVDRIATFITLSRHIILRSFKQMD